MLLVFPWLGEGSGLRKKCFNISNQLQNIRARISILVESGFMVGVKEGHLWNGFHLEPLMMEVRGAAAAAAATIPALGVK